MGEGGLGIINLVHSSKFTIFAAMGYNTFKTIPDNCGYVYGLLDEGNVFYVGITDYILFRYKQHFIEPTCSNYIRAMLIAGKMPGCVIYGMYNTASELLAAEHSLICHFASIGNKLCNIDQNPITNRIITPFDGSVKVPRCKKYSSNKIIEPAIEKYKQYRLCRKIS